jgi:hypothetical protein
VSLVEPVPGVEIPEARNEQLIRWVEPWEWQRIRASHARISVRGDSAAGEAMKISETADFMVRMSSILIFRFGAIVNFLSC